MGFSNRGNDDSSPGRLRNAGLCHFALDVAENFFVGFLLHIFFWCHKAIMSCPERQERSVQTSSARNLPRFLKRFIKKLTRDVGPPGPERCG